MRPAVARIAVVAVAVLLWEILARAFGDPILISPPSKAIAALGALFTDPGVVRALLLTLTELAVAFVLAAAIGTVVGLAVGLHSFSRGAFYPVILLLYAIPQATILPLVILALGIGPAAKIAFGVTHGMFPIAIAVIAGAQNISRILEKTAYSMGASRLQIIRHVVFPHIVTSFFTGLRLCMAGVLLGVILAELYASTGGIGFFARSFAESFKPPELFALVAVLSTMAVMFNELCRLAESYFCRWQR